MEKIIAHCGLDCAKCDAYVATQSGERAALERVAAKWREQFSAPEMTADSIICDGCLAGDNGHRVAHYCTVCAIRACAMERGHANCAHCADYMHKDALCEKLKGFLENSPEARATLDGIREGLRAQM
jgi:hypothetical protein